MQVKKFEERESGSTAPLIHKVGTIRRCVDRFAARSHDSNAKSLRYLADTRLVETQTRAWTLWWKGQYFVSSGDKTTTSFVQPVTLSLFTRSYVRFPVQRKMWSIFTKCGITVSLKGHPPNPPPPPQQSHNFLFPAVPMRINKTAVARKCLRSGEFHSNT